MVFYMRLFRGRLQGSTVSTLERFLRENLLKHDLLVEVRIATDFPALGRAPPEDERISYVDHKSKYACLDSFGMHT